MDIQSVLDKHNLVFNEIPPRRPPNRGFEHVIQLEEGSKLVITTPYRHSKRFKEIEKVIEELSDMGRIRPRSSPFASSIVLVKKKDGTMEMCIDYCALNKKTIKNRYHIPKIDELLDELHGVVYFLKIDLKFGYYHIRLMSFSLTNASTNFQSCMNHIFNKQLQKFLLLFFDVFSFTVRHGSTILDILMRCWASWSVDVGAASGLILPAMSLKNKLNA